MSQFDKHTTAEYIDSLRVFLGEPKRDFLVRAGFVKEGEQRTGRLTGYDPVALKALESRVNEKAALAESYDTTLGERYLLARDYQGFSDAKVAKHLGFSRELVRRWGKDISAPSCMPELAELLNVPLKWLQEGGEHNLVANTHLGVRVGEESLQWREALFSLIQTELSELEEAEDEQYIQAYIEWAVFNKPELATAARLSGGRWQFINNSLLFAPWVPIPERGLVRRYWSDEVEEIIQEELNTQHSIYAAWEAIRVRCTALGLSEDEFPKRISLHKRVERERDLAEKFGVDMNNMISAAVEKYQYH